MRVLWVIHNFSNGYFWQQNCWKSCALTIEHGTIYSISTLFQIQGLVEIIDAETSLFDLFDHVLDPNNDFSRNKNTQTPRDDDSDVSPGHIPRHIHFPLPDNSPTFLCGAEHSSIPPSPSANLMDANNHQSNVKRRQNVQNW